MVSMDAASGGGVSDDATEEGSRLAGRGASPAHFIGFMLGDKLKFASPRSRVVGVALKDRAAVLMAGKWPYAERAAKAFDNGARFWNKASK